MQRRERKACAWKAPPILSDVAAEGEKGNKGPSSSVAISPCSLHFYSSLGERAKEKSPPQVHREKRDLPICRWSRMRLPGHSRRYLIRSCVESKLFCKSRTQRLEREAEKGPTTTTDPPPLPPPPPPPHGAQLLNTKVDPRKRRRGGEEKKKKKGRRRRKKFSKGKGKKVGESPPLPHFPVVLFPFSDAGTISSVPIRGGRRNRERERTEGISYIHPPTSSASPPLSTLRIPPPLVMSAHEGVV